MPSINTDEIQEKRGLHYRLLENPLIYNLKTIILSLGRQSVCDYIQCNVNLPVSANVLDVGCGTGRHSRIFSCSFWGTDLNSKYISYAKKHYRGTFGVMDVMDLAFPPASFDFVFCVGLLHHLSDHQARRAVREMLRVSKQEGSVFLIEGVFPPKTNLLGYLLFKYDKGCYTRALDNLKDLLAQEGFCLKESNIPGSFPYQRVVFSNQ